MAKAWEQKPREFEKWAEDERPSESEIVDAIRTLTALGSCWLDRDVEKRGIDGDQRRRLVEVVKMLREAATAQRKQVESLAAIVFRDRVAVALGAKAERVEGGFTVGRKRKRTHLASFVPIELATEQVKILDRGGGPLPERNSSAEQALFVSIRAGFYEWNQTVCWSNSTDTNVSTADEQTAPPGDEDFRKAAKYGMRLRRKVPNGGARVTPVDAANRIVSDLINFDRDRLGEDISDGAVTQRLNRALNARHLDRGIWGKTSYDIGNYFGATTTVKVTDLDPQYRFDDAAERSRAEPRVIETIHEQLEAFFGEAALDEPASDLIAGVIDELERHFREFTPDDPVAALRGASPRRWAAATLTSKVWTADTEIAKALFHSAPEPDGDDPSGYSWKASARGCPVPQTLEVTRNADPTAAAMARFRRGLPPEWPADLPELSPEEVNRIGKELVAKEPLVVAVWESTSLLLFEAHGDPACANSPSRVLGGRAILNAALSMRLSPFQNPLDLALLGLLAARRTLDSPAETDGIAWDYVAAVEAVIFLGEQGFWRDELANAVSEILEAGA